jgi:hypothetical protein
MDFAPITGFNPVAYRFEHNLEKEGVIFHVQPGLDSYPIHLLLPRRRTEELLTLQVTSEHGTVLCERTFSGVELRRRQWPQPLDLYISPTELSPTQINVQLRGTFGRKRINCFDKVLFRESPGLIVKLKKCSKGVRFVQLND